MNGEPAAIRFAPPEGDRGVGLQVAPMVDIVFLLICFFTLTTRLVQAQKDPAVELPVMVSPEAEKELPTDLTINLRPDGTVTVDGQEVTPAGVGGVVSARLDRARSAREHVRVVVRADRRLRFARLDEVLDACRRAGAAHVVFRALGGEP